MTLGPVHPMFNAGCLIPTFCNFQEGTLQWGWSTFHSSCYFCGGEGRLEDLILSIQSIVCVHTKNEAFTAECPCPFLEIEERVYGCDKIEFCLVVKYQLSVSLIHRNQVLIIPLFFSFFVYLIMTQPCFLKPTLQLWVLNPDRTCYQSLDCIFILCWWAGMGNSSYATEDLFAVTDTIGCFGHPSLPCLFTVEVT